jgi:P27 family predicted phage terminase small subunit
VRGSKGAVQPSDNALSELPEVPDWFTEEAASEWNRTGPDLVERRVLTLDSVASFEAYCCTVSDYQRASKQIAKDGEIITLKGRKMRHPSYQTKFQALTEMRRLAAELALTPAARAKAGQAPAQGELRWTDDLISG